MIGIDFNLPINFDQYTFADLSKGLANEYRADCFLTTDRLPSQETIRQMRSTLSRQLSGKKFLLFRPISMYGFCSDNISAESSGYRNMSASNETETLSLRHSRQCLSNHSCRSERKSKLENIRGFCTDSDKQSANALRQRRLRPATGPGGLRSGFINHRFMFVTVPMGKISQAQSCCQDTYADGLKRLYTYFYPHYKRKSPRCKYPRRYSFRTGSHLRNGSWLPRLCAPLYFHSKPFNFCYKSQNQFRLSTSLLPQSRQNNRPSMRPDDKAQWLLCIAGLSGGSSPNRLLRHRNKQKVRIPYKQFFTGRIGYRSTLQVPLANRNLFQMDQAIPTNQNLFRHQHQCRQNPNLDSYQRLRSGCDCQERTQNRVEFERNPANSQHYAFRESPCYTSTYKKCLAKPKCSIS